MYNTEQISSSKKSRNDAFRDSIWSDQMYLDEIAKYKNEDWYDRLLENPYMRSKQAEFVADPLTDLFNWKGAASKYYSGMRTDAMNWLSDTLSQMHQQDYDSASEQVARNDVAGLNSDLLGSVTPGSAAENDTPPVPSFANGGSETGASIAQAGLSFIGGVLGFAQQIQGLNIGASQLVATEVGANESSFDSVTKQVASLLPLKDYDNLSKIDSDSLVADIQAAVKTSGYELTKAGFSRRTQKYLKRWYEQLANGDSMAVEAVRSELRNNILKSNEESAVIKSSPYYSDDFNDWIANIGENLSKFVAIADSYSAQIAAAQGEAGVSFWNEKDKNGSFVNRERYKNLLGSDMSVRETQNASVIASSKYQAEMENTWNSLLNAVKGDGKHWYNTIGMVLIQALRSQVMQPLHFGFSSSESQSPGRYGTGTSRSRGFHF